MITLWQKFFSILKTECIYRHKPTTFCEANFTNFDLNLNHDVLTAPFLKSLQKANESGTAIEDEDDDFLVSAFQSALKSHDASNRQK